MLTGEVEGSLRNLLSSSSLSCATAMASKSIVDGEGVTVVMRDKASATNMAEIVGKLGNIIQMANFSGGMTVDGSAYVSGLWSVKTKN